MYKDKNGNEIKVGDRISVTGVVEIAAEPDMGGYLTARLDSSEFPRNTATTPLLASRVAVIAEPTKGEVQP